MPSMSQSKRRGLTLAESIVVLVIIGILIALLLPALTHRAYPNANRSKCMNNLKQLTLAAHNYASTYDDRIPPAYGRMTTEDGKVIGGSILFWLLPYLEQDAVFREAYKNGGGNWSGPNGPQTRSIKYYTCPADMTNQGGLAATPTNTHTVCVSYAANYLLFGRGDAVDPWDPSCTQLPRYTIAEVPDGTSNTVMFSEHAAVSLDSRSSKVMVYGPDNGGLPAGTVLPLFNYAGHDAAPLKWDGNSDPPGGHFWMVQLNPTIITGANPPTYRMVQGYHPATLVIGVADGSVRGVSASVTPRTWQRAIDPADGALLGTDW
jgi:prepilin-type N-terminal cleavage/methylation domain-containing protein